MVSICHERWIVLISNNSAFKKTITWSWLIAYRSTIAKYLANFPTLTENEVTPSKNNNTHSPIQKEKRLVLSSRNSVTHFRLQPVIRYENNIFTFGSITKLPKTVDLQTKFLAVIFCSLHFIRLNERKEAFDGINLICYRPFYILISERAKISSLNPWQPSAGLGEIAAGSCTELGRVQKGVSSQFIKCSHLCYFRSSEVVLFSSQLKTSHITELLKSVAKAQILRFKKYFISYEIFFRKIK